MTDIITTAPISIPRLGRLRLKLPKPNIGAALATVFIAIGDAMTLAYIEPYQPCRKQPPTAIGTNLHGRDPSW